MALQVDCLLLEHVGEEQIPAIGQHQLQHRLASAFTALEQYRQQGLLRWYGLSADWALWPDAADRGYRPGLALEQVLQLAQDVGGEQHGFRCIGMARCIAFVVTGTAVLHAHMQSR